MNDVYINNLKVLLKKVLDKKEFVLLTIDIKNHSNLFK